MMKPQTKITIEIACSEPPTLTSEANDIRDWVINELRLNQIETALEFSVEVKIVGVENNG